MIKKLPYEESNYEDLIKGNYEYVDKTEYIEKLENLYDTFIFFLRPNGFGKSLFASILENYYDINKGKDFERLFGETYIGRNPTPLRNSYYILKFNFSGLITDTEETLIGSFSQACNKAYDQFIKKYNLDMKYTIMKYPSDTFRLFLSKLEFKIDRPVYVIIDDYDYFANKLLSFNTALFSNIISETSFVRTWYEVLKLGTESIVQRIFATGTVPIALNDIISGGFNISTDITRDTKFNEMMGFTEDEVKELLRRTIQNEKEAEKALEKMKINFSGYLFAEKGVNSIFNSTMVLYYLKNLEETGNVPTELIDKNIADYYGNLSNAAKLKDMKSNYKVFDSIFKGERITSTIASQFSLGKDFDEEDFKSLLFYLGLLTIDKPRISRVSLQTPNCVIKSLYFDFFAKKLRENIDYELSISESVNSFV